MPKYNRADLKQQADSALTEAKKVIASPAGYPADILALSNKLAALNEIGYARKVLLKADLGRLASNDFLQLRIQKQLALYTYKDQDLPIDARLTEADKMLQDLLARLPKQPSTTDLRELTQDAWGIRGGIHKLRWMSYGSRESLLRSLDCYFAGYNMGLNPDAGAYTGLNAAFVLDASVAHLASNEPAATKCRNDAEQIRSAVIGFLKPLAGQDNFTTDQWYYAKLAEAYLGIGQYKLARESAEKVAEADLRNWELETMARQFAHLARLQALKERREDDQLEESEAWSVLKTLLDNDATAALSFFRGKVGLALSGGGFRASLYHIGVLANLAERDMLRHVEVISCVSGGSILGMYYYLKLRNLLQAKPDANIIRDDYVELVRQIECEFLDGVQKNLRMRALFSPASNLLVLFSRASSTSNRLGRLYESELYAKAVGPGPHYMDQLKIQPAGQEDFYPRYDNWRRKAKVPIIVLNSTTLNTCHNWQFTTTFMGEPPQTLADAQIDSNDRLRRMYYTEAPTSYRQVRLGDAVAASACVPGLFDPLVLDRLYEQDYVVRLVDGGVYDNQGIATLHEQECQVMLVSDASGQTGIELDPSGERLGVSTRANNVLMARIRQCQHQLLCSLQETTLLRGLMFVHLKKGLAAATVEWLGCSDRTLTPPSDKLTTYQIRQDVQRALASVRTDLDSFSDCEADALMLSGYRATAEELPKSVTGFPLDPSPADTRWRFMDISGIASELNDDEPKLRELQRALKIARSLAFKAFQLLPGITAGKVVGMVLALGVVVAGLIFYWNTSGPIVKILGVLAGFFLLSLVAEALLVRTLRYRNSVLQWIGSLLLVVIGGPFLWIHLNVLDRYYIGWGPKYRHGTACPEQIVPKNPMVPRANG
jgi:predicted acylesterase/phospholipase RssA